MDRYYSKIIGMEYVINDPFEVVFEDGVKYSRNEMQEIKDASDKTKNNIHKIKKIFGGTIECP